MRPISIGILFGAVVTSIFIGMLRAIASALAS